MTEWNQTTLGKVLMPKGYIRGPFGSALRRNEMKNYGIPVYEQQNAIYNSRNFRFFIDNDKFEHLKRFKVETNDLIISCSGTVGKVSIISENDPKGIISQALLILRSDPNIICTKYLYYFLTSNIGFNLITQASHGSVQVNIAERKDVESIELNLPTLPEQKAIASVLSSLDDKIDLLHRQNITLEGIAEALFKQWFVVEAKDDWEETTIGDYITCYDNLRIPLSSLERNKMKYGQLYPYYGAAKIVDYINDFIFNDEYLLIAEDGTVRTDDGYPILQLVSGKFWVNNHTHVLQAKSPYTNFFIYIYLLKYNIDSSITGAVQPKINQSNLFKIKFINFPYDLLNRYNSLVLPIENKIKINKYNIILLQKIRDLLLPQLLNGNVQCAL